MEPLQIAMLVLATAVSLNVYLISIVIRRHSRDQISYIDEKERFYDLMDKYGYKHHETVEYLTLLKTKRDLIDANRRLEKGIRKYKGFAANNKAEQRV